MKDKNLKEPDAAMQFDLLWSGVGVIFLTRENILQSNQAFFLVPGQRARNRFFFIQQVFLLLRAGQVEVP